VKYELWHSASERSYILLLEGNRSADELKAPDARVIWTVEAYSYKDALQKRNDFLERTGVAPAPLADEHTLQEHDGALERCGKCRKLLPESSYVYGPGHAGYKCPHCGEVDAWGDLSGP
jgi:hypothetical protein